VLQSVFGSKDEFINYFCSEISEFVDSYNAKTDDSFLVKVEKSGFVNFISKKMTFSKNPICSFKKET